MVDARVSYPAQLQEELDRLGYHYRVVNQGVSGETTSGGLARLGGALTLDPELVILELGANDGLRGIPIEVARKNLATMIEAFKERETMVVLAGLTLPRNYGRTTSGNSRRCSPSLRNSTTQLSSHFSSKG